MNYEKLCRNLAVFAGGVLFGSAGLKLLSSRDAKKAYTHATAAVLRMKDSVMETVTTVQENAADILASAKDLNAQREEHEEVYEHEEPDECEKPDEQAEPDKCEEQEAADASGQTGEG